MYRARNSRATLRNCGDAGVRRLLLLLLLLPFLPFNRVALFAAQITRESLDTRAPGGGIESRRHYYHHP